MSRYFPSYRFILLFCLKPKRTVRESFIKRFRVCESDFPVVQEHLQSEVELYRPLSSWSFKDRSHSSIVYL